MSSSDTTATGPRVLFVYFTYTEQSLKVAEAMAEVLRERGCDVRLARIELTDSRWAERFTRFPLRHALFDILGMMPAQLRGATGRKPPVRARRLDQRAGRRSRRRYPARQKGAANVPLARILRISDPPERRPLRRA